MKNYFLLSISCIVSIAFFSCGSDDGGTTSTTLESPTSISLDATFVGRFDFTTDTEPGHGPLFDWSGSSIRTRFFGTAIYAKIRTYPGYEPTEGEENYLDLIIDNEVIKKIKIASGEVMYPLG